ncbi:MAG TPA: hypothetical protein VJ715_04820 [Pyrinomonadaceae bacterium]|nr:hypothetical protein [Pyrinomonadaceae bacterium]
MRRTCMIGIILTVVFSLGFGAVVAEGPDFSGSWALDRSRSIGMPPGMDQTMTVVQTGDKIELETKLITAQGERVVKDAYKLDGKETEFTPQGPQGPAGKGKRTAKWLPRGNGIVVSEESTVPTDKGPVTSQLVRKWILSPDGTTLTIDMYHDTPNGSFETKRIFIRKAK